MFNGKSPATFFVKLFEKEKDANDNDTKEDIDEINEDFAERPNGMEGRKRSQSMFAPNVASLLAGNQIGGKVESVQTAMRDVLTSLSSQPYLSIPALPPLPHLTTISKQFASSESIEDVNNDDQDDVSDHSDEIQNLNFLRTNCDRLTQRRATDFSQANSDLQRFLANRKCGGQDEPCSPMVDVTRPRELMKSNLKMYGSVETIDCDEDNGASRGSERNKIFRVESHSSKYQEMSDVPSMPVLENPEHQTKWYYKYFLGKLHQNLIGLDNDGGVYILSVLQEKSFGKLQYRAILWSKNGPKRLQFCSQGKSVTIKQLLSNFGHLDKVEKLPREIVNPNVQKDILWMEKQEGSMNFKFGIIYAKAGQIMDDELFSNETGSKNFLKFLSLMGDRIQLKDWSKFRGGLDVRGNMTGPESVYTTHEEHEIMFHVSTLLPFSQDDKQQVERKRHIGNDIVNIIFVDGDREAMSKFRPVFIKSQFTHVYAVVCIENDSYYLTLYSEKSVPLFGPSVPRQGFLDHMAFRKFLLVKCINGEKATYNTSVFSTKRERTFQILLEDAHNEYGREPNSKQSSTILDTLEGGHTMLHSYKKREDSRKDIFVKVGQSLKLENTINGELGVLTPRTPSMNKRHRRHKDSEAGGNPWNPDCVHPCLQMEVLAGDLWHGHGVLVAAKEGAWLVRTSQDSEKIFSLTSIVQINVMESLGILIFRTEKCGKDQSQVWVYRLSAIEEAHQAPGKEELKEHSLESTKGCSQYSISQREHSSLTLGVIVNRKIILYKWKHAEEWITFSDDTVEGFDVLTELQCDEQPLVLSILSLSPQKDVSRHVLIGTRRSWYIVNTETQEEEIILPLKTGDNPIFCQELWEDDLLQLVLTHNCTSSILQKQLQSPAGCSPPTSPAGWEMVRQLSWSCHPLTVVPVYPYILAMSLDTMEVRSQVNGTLLQTLNLPKLTFLSAKEDIYLTTTKQRPRRGQGEMEPMSKFCDPASQCHIYKINWSSLVGGGPGGGGNTST